MNIMTLFGHIAPWCIIIFAALTAFPFGKKPSDNSKKEKSY